MSRKKQWHNHELESWLSDYAEKRALDFHKYSEYHMRLMDGGYIAIDIWTTEKYWVKQTDYFKITDKTIIERGGEKGTLPYGKENIEEWLDKLFYAADML
jgi:hypothetical protein